MSHFSQNIRSSFVRGFAFGFSQAIVFFAMAGIFRFGAFLVLEERIDYEDMFKCVFPRKNCNTSIFHQISNSTKLKQATKQICVFN